MLTTILILTFIFNAFALNYLKCEKDKIIRNFLNNVHADYSRNMIYKYNETGIVPDYDCSFFDLECTQVINFIKAIKKFDEMKNDVHSEYYNFYNELYVIDSMKVCLTNNNINSEYELFDYSFDDFYIFISNCIDVKYYFKDFVNIKNKYRDLINFYLFKIPIRERYLFNYCEP